MVVQQLWVTHKECDEPNLERAPLRIWGEWESELPILQQISLPLCYCSPELDTTSSRWDIHVFCDASERAYGSVAYLRTEDESGRGHLPSCKITCSSKEAADIPAPVCSPDRSTASHRAHELTHPHYPCCGRTPPPYSRGLARTLAGTRSLRAPGWWKSRTLPTTNPGVTLTRTATHRRRHPCSYTFRE